MRGGVFLQVIKRALIAGQRGFFDLACAAISDVDFEALGQGSRVNDCLRILADLVQSLLCSAPIAETERAPVALTLESAIYPDWAVAFRVPWSLFPGRAVGCVSAL